MINIKYSKLKTVQALLQETDMQRKNLLSEMITNATDSVIFMRRIRMLSQLAQMEAQLLTKIKNFETKDPGDLDLAAMIGEIRNVTDRSS